MTKKKGFITLFIVSFLICSLNSYVYADKIYTEPATGYVELERTGYPVLMFVPKHYDASKPYPLLITFPDEFEKLDEHLESWEGTAKRRSLIVMVPSVKPLESSVPYNTDEWLFGVVDKISERYRIAPDRIYLVGHGNAAHYASYLGTKYGERLSGVGLINGSWVGSFEQLMEIPSRPIEQVPFFISFAPDNQDGFKLAEEKALKFSEKGYLLHMETVEDKEEFNSGEFKRRVVDWLEEKSANWRVVVAESGRKSKKEKLRRWLDRNIRVDN